MTANIPIALLDLYCFLVIAQRELTALQSDFVSLGFECFQTTDIPSCLDAVTDFEATATVDYNAACCTSISKWGLSIESCLAKNAPSCLDTSGTRSHPTSQFQSIQSIVPH